MNPIGLQAFLLSIQSNPVELFFAIIIILFVTAVSIAVWEQGKV